MLEFFFDISSYMLVTSVDFSLKFFFHSIDNFCQKHQVLYYLTGFHQDLIAYQYYENYNLILMFEETNYNINKLYWKSYNKLYWTKNHFFLNRFNLNLYIAKESDNFYQTLESKILEKFLSFESNKISFDVNLNYFQNVDNFDKNLQFRLDELNTLCSDYTFLIHNINSNRPYDVISTTHLNLDLYYLRQETKRVNKHLIHCFRL